MLLDFADGILQIFEIESGQGMEGNGRHECRRCNATFGRADHLKRHAKIRKCHRRGAWLKIYALNTTQTPGGAGTVARVAMISVAETYCPAIFAVVMRLSSISIFSLPTLANRRGQRQRVTGAASSS